MIDLVKIYKAAYGAQRPMPHPHIAGKMGRQLAGLQAVADAVLDEAVKVCPMCAATIRALKFGKDKAP